MNGVTWAFRLRRHAAAAVLVLLGALGGLLPQTAQANSVKDALNLAAKFAPVVDTYIAPASLTWLPGLYDALSNSECTNLSSDVAVANCAGALLDSDAGKSLGDSSSALVNLLEIYVDVRSSDWAELFNDIFRLAASGSPLDVACKVLSLAVGGFPVCGVLEVLYAIGEAAYEVAKGLVKVFSINDWGESEAMDLVAYFNQYFLPQVERYAQDARQNWQSTWDRTESELITPCRNYLVNHRNASDTASLRCREGMFKGQQAGVEPRFIDKGFLQFVSVRYAMLTLPGVVDQRFAVMAAGLDANAPGLRDRLLGVWGLNNAGKTVLDGNGIGSWPQGSVGAVAAARLKLYIPRYGDGEPVMKQKLQEAVDYALANTPGWNAWKQVATAAGSVPCKTRADGTAYACGDWDKVRECKANYATPLQALPRAVDSSRIPPPPCWVEDVDGANRVALIMVNKALRAELKLSGCSYDMGKNPHVIECVPLSESAKQCASLLKQRYGEFGLPSDGGKCTGLTAIATPPNVPTQLPAGTLHSGREVPPSVSPPAPVLVQRRDPVDNVPANTPAPVSTNRIPVAVTPAAAPPLCTPTQERGVMQCHTQESMPNCERARRLGQVKQCLPPPSR